MTVEKHDTSGSMENTLVPVSEKYTLTIKEAASFLTSVRRKCVDWQKTTGEDLRYLAETDI